MMLGKRPRPAMARTASMAGLSDGLPVTIDYPPPPSAEAAAAAKNPRLTSHIEPTSSTLELPHFLKACGLCRRRLGPGRDIFMYRGEMGFCSLECRQKQISMDEESCRGRCGPAGNRD